MFVLGNLISAIAMILDMILRIYLWVIIIRALISWVNPDPYNPIVQMLYKVTEPVLNRIRRLVPGGSMGMDLSPIIAIFVIYFLQHFLVQTLFGIARRLQ